jgi:decaprenylphospho-beta-D-ribofuranose 2-oxidase
MLPDGRIERLSPTARPDLFHATIGGIGLTGIILAVAFRLRRVPSNAMRVTERRMPDLDRFMAELGEARRTAPYSVGWIDAMARGPALGRGILETAAPADLGVADKPARRRRVPIDLPGIALSSVNVRCFNALYYRRVPAAGRDRRVAIGRFLYPLDAIGDWNRIYGKRGFRQFQCVIPDAEAGAGIPALMEVISAARGASFLAVLKTLGGSGPGPLSFALPGFTLALDFAERPGLTDLMAKLHRVTLDHGGRIYLAKDGCLDAGDFAAMYPRLGEMRAILADIDPDHRMESDMARRLGIRP